MGRAVARRVDALFAATILVFLALAPGGCGYRFSGEGAGPRPGLTAIAIPVFENNTSEPDLGSIFAGALRQEFIRKGALKVAPTDETDVVFLGNITNIYTSPLAHREFEATVLSRVYVTLDVRCRDTRTGEVLWQDPAFTYYQVYVQADDSMVSFVNRQDALKILAREMAIRIHDRFLSNF